MKYALSGYSDLHSMGDQVPGKSKRSLSPQRLYCCIYLLAIVMALGACGERGTPGDPWGVLETVSGDKGLVLSGPQSGPRGQLMIGVGAEGEAPVRVSIWPPGSEGPAFAEVGSLRLTFERGEKVGVTPLAVQSTVLMIKDGLEQAGCASRGKDCFGLISAAIREPAAEMDSPPAPARPFLNYLWLVVLVFGLGYGVRSRIKAGQRHQLIWAFLCVLLSSGLAWQLGTHGFLVENFRAGTVVQESLRADHTSVHGDSIYALMGAALEWGDLHESWIFRANMFCGAMAVLFLALLLFELGFSVFATVGATLFLGLHPLWLRYVSTEALVVPNTLLLLLLLTHLVRLPGLYGDENRRFRGYDFCLDLLLLVLVLGGRPELVGTSVIMVLFSCWICVRRTPHQKWRALALIGALVVACAAHYTRFDILSQAAEGEYLGRYPGYGPGTWGYLAVHGLVGSPTLLLGALCAVFWKPHQPGLRALAFIAWMGGLLPHLHIFEGHLAGSHLRLTTQTLAPLALLAAPGLEWLKYNVETRSRKWFPWVVVGLSAAVVSPALLSQDIIDPRALETEQGKVAREILCSYEGPPLRFVAMPRRSDDLGVLLPATSSHLVEVCFPNDPAYLSLTDLTEGRLSLRKGERGLIWLDAVCHIEVLDDAGVFRAQPVAALCDKVEREIPAKLLDSRNLTGAIIKPSRRPRQDQGVIKSQLYLLEGPWPERGE